MVLTLLSITIHTCHLNIIYYYIVGTVPSPINPLTDTIPHQVIPQYDNVDMITNTLPTTELEMNTCAAYDVI